MRRFLTFLLLGLAPVPMAAQRGPTRIHPSVTLDPPQGRTRHIDFTTDEVWQILLQRQPPWGGSHRDLITLYRNASGGECPLVIDKDQAPSCGTGSSRFGCWTCTVVEKDRSM
ncbi:MAG: hypothetical protein JNL98_41560, partial [Bryobacterales bacterium]|nr:hypothetical protein [Bryobacterales bacterium]